MPIAIGWTNNTKLWRPKNGKWRWLLFDTDLGFGLAPRWGHPGGVEHNTLIWAMNCCEAPEKHNSPENTIYFRSFLKNESFRQAFIQRFNYHLNHTFCIDRVKLLIDEMAAKIENEIPHQIARWNGIADIKTWQKNVQELRDFAEKRHDYLHRHLQEYFSLNEVQDLHMFVNPINAGTISIQWNYPFEHISCSNKLLNPSFVNLVLTANEGFEFLTWSNQNKTDKENEFLWDGNESITAFFSSSSSFSLSPNPTTRTIHVQWSDTYNILQIYNSVGQIVYEKKNKSKCISTRKNIIESPA